MQSDKGTTKSVEQTTAEPASSGNSGSAGGVSTDSGIAMLQGLGAITAPVPEVNAAELALSIIKQLEAVTNRAVVLKVIRTAVAYFGIDKEEL